MSLGIHTRGSLPVFSPLSIASMFGNSVLLLLVFNETSVFAILGCRATLGSGSVILPGRFDGGLLQSFAQEGQRKPELQQGRFSLHLSKLSSPLGRTQKKKNEEIFGNLGSKSPLEAKA